MTGIHRKHLSSILLSLILLLISLVSERLEVCDVLEDTAIIVIDYNVVNSGCCLLGNLWRHNLLLGSLLLLVPDLLLMYLLRRLHHNWGNLLRHHVGLQLLLPVYLLNGCEYFLRNRPLRCVHSAIRGPQLMLMLLEFVVTTRGCARRRTARRRLQQTQQLTAQENASVTH